MSTVQDQDYDAAAKQLEAALFLEFPGHTWHVLTIREMRNQHEDPGPEQSRLVAAIDDGIHHTRMTVSRHALAMSRGSLVRFVGNAMLFSIERLKSGGSFP